MFNCKSGAGLVPHYKMPERERHFEYLKGSSNRTAFCARLEKLTVESLIDRERSHQASTYSHRVDGSGMGKPSSRKPSK
jgi:hypothetical protein